MAISNQYDISNKYKGKIKFRNLDPELQAMIKSLTNGNYNDEEIQEKIALIEQNLQSYIKKYSDLDSKVNNAATITKLEEYREKNVDITYYDLDANLKTLIDNPVQLPNIDEDTIHQMQNDLKTLNDKVNLNLTNINNNSVQIASLNNDLFNFQSESNNNDNAHDIAIKNNLDKIAHLEDEIRNGISVDVDKLAPALQEKINKIDPMYSDITTLKQQVSTNTTNITVNKNSITAIQNQLDNYKTNVNTSLNSINDSITIYNDKISSLENEMNTLTITNIIAKSANPNIPDAGKIVKDNLSSELISTIDNISNIDDLADNINNPGKNVHGDDGQFIYKNNTDLSTKPLMFSMYIALNKETLDTYIENFYSPIYDIETGSVWSYEQTTDTTEGDSSETIDNGDSTENGAESTNDTNTDDGSETTDDNNTENISGTWNESTDGINTNRYNYTFIFDPETDILYYNNSGQLISIVNTDNFREGISVGDWMFNTDDNNNFILYYNDQIINLWSIDDTITKNAAIASNITADYSNSISLNDWRIFVDSNNYLTITKNNEVIVKLTGENESTLSSIKYQNEQEIVLQPQEQKDIDIDSSQLYNAKVLLLDNDISSKTYGLYINSEKVVLAYLEKGLRIINTNDKIITTKIIF